eukprot:7173265-Pyramimonas_sp.AAC.1
MDFSRSLVEAYMEVPDERNKAIHDHIRMVKSKCDEMCVPVESSLSPTRHCGKGELPEAERLLGQRHQQHSGTPREMWVDG